MGIIVRELTLYGRRRSARVTALFDTGASKSLIRRELADRLGELIELPEPERFEMAKGGFSTREGFVGSVGLNRVRLAHLFRVIDNLTEDIILGADFLQQWDIRLHPRKKKITIDPRALKLKAVGNRIVRR